MSDKVNGAKHEAAIGKMPLTVGVEIAPCEQGIAIRLSDNEGNSLTGAFSPHQARAVAAQLAALADAGSEPKAVTIFVVTAAEAWVPGQVMTTKLEGGGLKHTFSVPFGKQLVKPKPKLILPG